MPSGYIGHTKSMALTDDGTTYHIWNGQNMVAEMDGDGELTAIYVRGINLIYSIFEDDSPIYYLYNGHGDVVQLVQGSIVTRSYVYDAFGNGKSIAGSPTAKRISSFEEYLDLTDEADYRNVSEMQWESAVSTILTPYSLALQVRGTLYEKSIYAHAQSTVTLDLNGEYDAFTSYFGLIDGAAGGNVAFEVIADGRTVYRSETVTYDSGAEAVSVCVSGVDELTLRVDRNGISDYDWSAWLNPRLYKSEALEYFETPGETAPAEDSDSNPFRYCGEYFDSETETIYLRARNYNPETGRFMSEDPIRDGLNYYAYCVNNPILLIDPSGLEFVVLTGGVAGYENNPYQFIETSILALIDLIAKFPDEAGTWIITNLGYSEKDVINFTQTASSLGVTLMMMDDKQQLFDYVNFKGGTMQDRIDDPITNFSVMSHGYTGALALAHGHDEQYGKLNIYIDDIGKMESYAFNQTTTWFGSCEAGTIDTFAGTSFAQAWSTKTGGHATAVVNGKTDYENIHVWPGKTFVDRIFNRIRRMRTGYSQKGSRNYPVASGGKWLTFTPPLQ